jgi:hypothetical protein
LEDDLLRGYRQFAANVLLAVVRGDNSSSILDGPNWDEAVVEALPRELGQDVAITTNGLHCVAALHVSGVNRPSVVLPPWFNNETVRLACSIGARGSVSDRTVCEDDRADVGRCTEASSAPAIELA